MDTQWKQKLTTEQARYERSLDRQMLELVQLEAVVAELSLKIEAKDQEATCAEAARSISAEREVLCCVVQGSLLGGCKGGVS